MGQLTTDFSLSSVFQSIASYRLLSSRLITMVCEALCWKFWNNGGFPHPGILYRWAGQTMIVMSWGRIKGLREHHDAMYKVYCERSCYFICLLNYYFPNFEPSTWKTCFDEDTKVWSGMTWTQCVPFCGLCAALCAIHILLLVCFIFGHYRKHIVPHWK